MNILLIITGSIAAVKAPELVRELKKRGDNVTCVMTKSAAHFVTETSLAYLSGNKVYTKMFDPSDEAEMAHISLSRNNDVILVAPATADFIAKLANGLCDDLASTICIASDKKIYLAPAMNTKMLEYPATQENLNKLQKWGFEIINPTEGLLACGEEGAGKMADIEDIISSLKFSKSQGALHPQKKSLKTGKLNGKKIIVTAGPTIEKLDPVRFISNFSSGKQGYAIAEALVGQGADVVLISGPTKLNKPIGLRFVSVNSADEMMQAVNKSLPVDCAIFAAAVSDWKAAEKKGNKIKKGKSNELNLTLSKNPDILQTVSNLKKNRPKLVIGFSAETENLIANSKAKLASKNCDYIVANLVGNRNNPVFGEDINTVSVISKKGEVFSIKNKPKVYIAEKITDFVQEIL